MSTQLQAHGDLKVVPGEKPDAALFNLRAPLLSQGREDTTLAETDLLKLRLKVYAAGGENAMHFHQWEDHSFIVLQGQATFRIGSDDNIKVVNKFEGVMLPRQVPYWFLSSGGENLVMIRAGASTKYPSRAEKQAREARGMVGAGDRCFPDGTPFPGNARENKEIERIEIPGKFFGN